MLHRLPGEVLGSRNTVTAVAILVCVALKECMSECCLQTFELTSEK